MSRLNRMSEKFHGTYNSIVYHTPFLILIFDILSCRRWHGILRQGVSASKYQVYCPSNIIQTIIFLCLSDEGCKDVKKKCFHQFTFSTLNLDFYIVYESCQELLDKDNIFEEKIIQFEKNHPIFSQNLKIWILKIKIDSLTFDWYADLELN